MSPADDALVVLLEAAEAGLYLITFKEFVLLRAVIAIAARFEGFDVLLLEPLVGIAVVVPIVVIRSNTTVGARLSSTRSALPHVHRDHRSGS